MNKTKPASKAPVAESAPTKTNLVLFNVFAVIPCIYFTIQAFGTSNGFMGLLALTFAPVALTVVGLDVYRLALRLRGKSSN